MSLDRILAAWPAPAAVQAYTVTRQGSAVLPATAPLPRQLQQVHDVHVVDAALSVDGVEADACFSRDPCYACRVITADCLPLLVCNRQATEWAAIHAGWRGLANGVIEATLAQLRSTPQELLVWLGPAISQAHFQVGAEVREHYLRAAPPPLAAAIDACFVADGDRYRADLYALARARLEYAGVSQVYGGGYCTYADPALFESYRRDGPASGRMVSLIYLNRDAI